MSADAPNPADRSAGLSHVGPDGAARMVDVSGKPGTARHAVAVGNVRMSDAAFAAVRDNTVKKGDVLGVARVAGVMAAKRTADLIPLCHPLPLSDVQVALELDETLPGVRVRTTARTVGPTGVEMEAMTAACVALLTVYDMTKAMDRGMVMSDVRLVEKGGGQSGLWMSS